MDGTRWEAIVTDRLEDRLPDPHRERIRACLDRLQSSGLRVLSTTQADADPVELVARLADEGVTGRLVAILTGDPAPAWPAPPRVSVLPIGADDGERLCGILRRQHRMRVERRVPSIDDDPEWVVRLPDAPGRERIAESIGALSNGYVGLRAGVEEDGPTSTPLLVAAGVYAAPVDDQPPALLAGPDWTSIAARRPLGGTRELDLRTGVLIRRGSRARSIRFVSAANPIAMAMRLQGNAADVDGTAWAERIDRLTDRTDPTDTVVRSGPPDGPGLLVASRDHADVRHEQRVLERLATWAVDGSGTGGVVAVRRALDELEAIGFDGLLGAHRREWATRWADALVDIDGSAEDQLAVRFAVFHLLSSAKGEGEAAVGARGLTGQAYGGHVFWDADVFVLPALAATRPAAARAMLEYRCRRLGRAQSSARRSGRAGARFPWESAQTGDDVTPHVARGKHGEPIPIRTAERAEHITADVAWAVQRYVDWTGDDAFLDGSGGDTMIECARYWADRLTEGDDGRLHILGVMGPDEYHEVVDDNAYTNVMARWLLRRAAPLAERRGLRTEAAAWRRAATSIADGWHADVGLYEQFRGYWDLEPLLITDIVRPPVAADVLLGPSRVARSQVIKQADVLMLHHLVPDEVEPGSLRLNLEHYSPRTAHGSSLSPAIHAALLARSGDPDAALAPFRLATRLDLDDLTGTTSGGLHLATIGGVWQAIAFGFCGIRADHRGLSVDPSLPTAWTAVTVRLRYRGNRLRIRAEHDRVVVDCVQPLSLMVRGRPQNCRAPTTTVDLDPNRQPERSRA